MQHGSARKRDRVLTRWGDGTAGGEAEGLSGTDADVCNVGVRKLRLTEAKSRFPPGVAIKKAKALTQRAQRKNGKGAAVVVAPLVISAKGTLSFA